VTDSDPRHEHLWEVGWEGHALAQRRRLARLTLIEKLDWLEETHAVVRHLERSRAGATGTITPSPRPPTEPGERRA